jgi:hypothetical protein
MVLTGSYLALEEGTASSSNQVFKRWYRHLDVLAAPCRVAQPTGGGETQVGLGGM